MMNSVLNGQLLQYCIMKTLNIILKELVCYTNKKSILWNGIEFPLTIQKIGKFEKNPGIAVIVLFSIKNGVRTAHRSELNGKSNKQATLLVVDGENRH